MRVDFTSAAQVDLDDIWPAIAPDCPNAADRMIDLVRKTTERLAAFPESGLLRPEISNDARCLPRKNYLILYRITDKQVEIVRVVHGARDVTALL